MSIKRILLLNAGLMGKLQLVAFILLLHLFIKWLDVQIWINGIESEVVNHVRRGQRY